MRVVHRRDRNRFGYTAAEVRVGDAAIGNQLRHRVACAGAVVLVDSGETHHRRTQHRRVVHRRQIDITVAGIADVILDVSCHHRDVALRGVGSVRTVGVADGAQRQLVVIGWQVATQGQGAGAAAAYRQAGDAVPVGAIAAGNGQCLTARVLHIADTDHNLPQVAVLVGNGCIGRGNFDSGAAFGIRRGVGHTVGHAVGIDRGRPDVGDGAGGPDRARRAAGRGAVGDGNSHGARPRVGVGVGVLVRDALDDVLVFKPGAGATDADAFGTAASHRDRAQAAIHAGTGGGKGLVDVSKQVVNATDRAPRGQRSACDHHGGRCHRVINHWAGNTAGGVHISDRHVGIGNRHRRAAHQKLFDKAGSAANAVATGAAGVVAIEVEHRCVVDVCDHQSGDIRQQRIRCRVATRGHIHLGRVRGAVGSIPQVVVQRPHRTVGGIGDEAQFVGG